MELPDETDLGRVATVVDELTTNCQLLKQLLPELDTDVQAIIYGCLGLNQRILRELITRSGIGPGPELLPDDAEEADGADPSLWLVGIPIEPAEQPTVSALLDDQESKTQFVELPLPEPLSAPEAQAETQRPIFNWGLNLVTLSDEMRLTLAGQETDFRVEAVVIVQVLDKLGQANLSSQTLLDSINQIYPGMISSLEVLERQLGFMFEILKRKGLAEKFNWLPDQGQLKLSGLISAPPESVRPVPVPTPPPPPAPKAPPLPAPLPQPETGPKVDKTEIAPDLAVVKGKKETYLELRDQRVNWYGELTDHEIEAAVTVLRCVAELGGNTNDEDLYEWIVNHPSNVSGEPGMGSLIGFAIDKLKRLLNKTQHILQKHDYHDFVFVPQTGSIKLNNVPDDIVVGGNPVSTYKKDPFKGKGRGRQPR